MKVKLLMENLYSNMYNVAVAFSMYFAYLIYNSHSLDVRSTIIITILLSGMAVLITYLLKKYIKIKEIPKNIIKIVAIISIFISLAILIENVNFFAKKTIQSQISIISLGEKNEYSNAEKVTLKYLVQGNEMCDLDSIETENGWKHEEGTICNEKNGKLSIELKKTSNIKLIFEKNENSGKIKIIDGDNEEIIDLYSYKSGLYDYKVNSNCYSDMFFGGRLICSFIMIYIMILLFILSSYYLYKTKKSLILPTLFLVFMLRINYYTSAQMYSLFPDSISYIYYNFKELFNLEFPGRTPIYPLFIRICFIIFGQNIFLNFVVLGQIVISFIAVIYFYKILRIITNNEKISAIVTLLYGGTVATCGWEHCILTESLAISGYIFFIYNIIKYIEKANLKNGISAVIIAIILTFLRPTSIILTVILFAFWIIRFIFDRKQIKTDFKCFIGSLISLIIIVIYSIIFYNTHYIYSISDPTIRQDLFICIDQGFYKASNDSQFIKDVEEMKEQLKDNKQLPNNNKVWVIEKKIQEEYGNERVQEISSYCKEKMKLEYFRYLINLVKDSSTIYYEGYSKLIPYDSIVLDMQIAIFKIVNFSHIYIMIIIEGLIVLYQWIKRRSVPWIHAGIFAFSISIIGTTFIGTNAEYMRTSLGVLPFFYMSFAMLLNYILKVKNN